MGEKQTVSWKDLIDSHNKDFHLYLEELKSEEEEEKIQESICSSDPLLDFIQCNKCKTLIPRTSFENHVTYTEECNRMISEQTKMKEWDEMENKRKKGKAIPVKEEEDEEVEDEEAKKKDEKDKEQTIYYSEEWVKSFERLSLPAELNKDCDPPNCSQTAFASVPYYTHIHCGVMKSGEPCQYIMTRCPIHNPKEKIKVPGRNFIEDCQKLKSAFEKILSKSKEFNSKFRCGLRTKQGMCMEFLFLCNHLFNKKGEVRQENSLKLIQGLIEIDPSLKNNSKNCPNGKRRKNPKFTKHRRLKKAISRPPDDKQDNNDSPMETDESNGSTNAFSSSPAINFSIDGKYYFERIELDFSSTLKPDPLWKAFEDALQKSLQNDLLTLSISDDDSEESRRED